MHRKVAPTIIALLLLVWAATPAHAGFGDTTDSNTGASAGDLGGGAVEGKIWVPEGGSTAGSAGKPGQGKGHWRPATSQEVADAKARLAACLAEVSSPGTTPQAALNYCQGISSVQLAIPTEQVIVTTATTRIQLPTPTPIIEPAPNRNEWNMVAVGYPLWLHVNGDTDLRSSTEVMGFTISLVAARGPVTFTMGDGNQVVCGQTTPWNINQAGQPSPTCGYTYQTKSLPNRYTVTASTTWTINWSGAGQSGTFTVDRTANVQLPVGELQTVVVGR